MVFSLSRRLFLIRCGICKRRREIPDSVLRGLERDIRKHMNKYAGGRKN